MPRPRAQVHSNSTYTAIVSSHSGYTRLAVPRPLTRATGARGLLTTLEAAPYTPYAPYAPYTPYTPLQVRAAC